MKGLAMLDKYVERELATHRRRGWAGPTGGRE